MCFASSLPWLTSCTLTEDLRVGIGGRGSGTIVSESYWEDDSDGEPHGVLIDGSWYDLRGRAADVTASIGSSWIHAIAGYEWSRTRGQAFQTRLFGVRAVMAEPDTDSGPYAILLGRAVDGPEDRTPFLDGFDLGVGFLGRLKGVLFGDVSLSWSLRSARGSRVGGR